MADDHEAHFTSEGLQELLVRYMQERTKDMGSIVGIARSILTRKLGPSARFSDEDAVKYGLIRADFDVSWHAKSHIESHVAFSSRDDLPTTIRLVVARRIIADKNEPHREVATERGASEELADEMAKHMPRLVDALRDGDRFVCEDGPVEEDDMLALDARAASYLERIGEKAKSLADGFRAGRRKAWLSYEPIAFTEWKRRHTEIGAMRPKVSEEWDRFVAEGLEGDPSESPITEWARSLEDLGPDPRVPLLEAWRTAPGEELGTLIEKTLARALWRDVVGPRLAKARRKLPALVPSVHAEAAALLSGTPKFDGKSLTFEGRELARLQAETGATFDLDVIARGLGLLGSVAAHRLFRWEVMTGHDRYLLGAAYPNVLEVEGGWSALARLVGLNPDKPKVTSDLRSIVHAQAHFAFSFPDGSRGNMLSYTEREARGRGGRAKVVITLGSPLLPGYVHNFPKGHRERKLVPLLREGVPLYGRPNEHGAQMTASLGVLGELRARARELVTEGGALLTHDDFTKIADRSGLPRKNILPVLGHWLAGDTRAAPFLKQTDRDRYTLSDAHAAERAFLEEGGRQELQGSVAGEKGAAKKRGKLARLGRK